MNPTKRVALAVTIGLVSSVAGVVSAAPEPTATAQAPQPVANTPVANPPPVDKDQVDQTQVVPSLMVMSAKNYTVANDKLTMHGVSPTTILFADRPKRLTGSVPTETFVSDWSKGRDSFEKVPPNADLSTFDDNGARNAVIELRNPVLVGDTLTYDIKVLKGQIARNGGQSSLFIDIIGMPLTPVSYAGVARRTARRAAYFSGPHVVAY